MNRTRLSVKEVAQGLAACIDSTCSYWQGESRAYRISTILCFDLERVYRICLARVVEDRTTTRRAIAGIAGGAHSRNAPGW